MAKIFSGITPSGKLHIGNYLGAIKNWVELQDKHECVYCIADYHAMTEPYEPSEMQKSTLELAADLLAAGINPTKSIFFIQSHVPEHTELAWILNTITSVPELERMIQFKEMSQRFGEKANVGLFDYPVLQAADILLYKTELVPVGEDQKQHLELTRTLARRFNSRFGQIFPEPKTLLTKTPRVMSLKDPSKKMSKSLGAAHYIALTDKPEVIQDKIKKAVTDTGEETGEMSPGVENLFTLLEIFGGKEVYEKFAAEHKEGKIKYSELKEELGRAISDYFADFRQKREELLADESELQEMLETGAKRAQEMARNNIAAVKEKVGLT
ncbi:MAG: tryptophan--tRNA ligase [Parcubacteria group bacterium]|nr:tryptophan--tRNA ligase [Parcubacteria group bacterium]